MEYRTLRQQTKLTKVLSLKCSTQVVETCVGALAAGRYYGLG
jgi:hypothetical protein